MRGVVPSWGGQDLLFKKVIGNKINGKSAMGEVIERIQGVSRKMLSIEAGFLGKISTKGYSAFRSCHPFLISNPSTIDNFSTLPAGSSFRYNPKLTVTPPLYI